EPDQRSVSVRYWSLLFLLGFLFCLGMYIYAPFHPDWWLPRDLSAHGPLAFGRQVDHLFWIILVITGVTFVGTEVALCLAAWRFAHEPGRKAQYFHGSQRLEVVWTIIPSAILVFIALYQMGTWADIKFRSSQPKVQPVAEVTARQFQWMIKYPG